MPRLTPDAVRKLTCKPGQKDQLVFDEVQKGLAVRVTATGSKTYLAQFSVAGTKRRVPLGAVNAISLPDARAAVQALLGDVAKGLDPAAERKAKAAANRAIAARERLTLAALVESWETLRLAQKRAKYAREAVRALRTAFAKHWDKPAEDLTRQAVVRVLDAMVAAGRLAMASRTAAYGKAAFTWAVKRGTLTANPFADLPAIGERPKRDRVLTDAELRKVWLAAEQYGPPFGNIVRLLALTGQRVSEVAGLRWSEVSDDLSTWTIPGSRTKNGAAHVVPLSEPVRTILRTLNRDGDLAMPGDTGGPFKGWSKAKARLDTACGVTGWTLHDLRRTLATGLQGLGVRLEVTEAVLNHISGSRGGIAGVYQRHDWQAEKRTALDAWAAHLMGIIEGRTTRGNVVRLGGAAS